MFIKRTPETLLQILHKVILNFQVIVKSVKDPIYNLNVKR